MFNNTKITFVVACDKNNVIGRNNNIPWVIKEDLKLFKKITTGGIILMGRKTFDSINNTPLPNRTNIILTKNKKENSENCIYISDINELDPSYENIFVIGGEKVFKLFMPYVDDIHQTLILDKYEGDTFFPRFNEEWTAFTTNYDTYKVTGPVYRYLIRDIDKEQTDGNMIAENSQILSAEAFKTFPLHEPLTPVALKLTI